jgi:glucose/arabinose dehydrogenase
MYSVNNRLKTKHITTILLLSFGILVAIFFFRHRQLTQLKRPAVLLVDPKNGSQNVSENASISTNILNLPNGGIDNSTLTSNTVYLSEAGSGALVPSNVNGTGGGDAITLVPSSRLKLNTTYNFNITDGVKDLSGASIIPYASTFSTASSSMGEITNVKFEKVPLNNTTGQHSSLTIGPDRKLYALSIDGIITRFSINNDGTLGTPEILYSLQDAYGARQPRLSIGFAFDPSSTPTNLVAWITHSTFVFLDGPTWDGKLTRLSGDSLQKVQDVLINLPRSAKDHLTNSITFGPDGALYFSQGSNTSMGYPDKTWNYRIEHLLSGAILRLDVSKLGALPLDLKTSEGGGTYNPYAANAPLTIYASGFRNAYDLVWHSNGNLYAPTNGSAAGGTTPTSVQGTLRPDGSTYNGPPILSIKDVQQTQNDYLFRVVKGGYYGHPNPLRGEYVMNGGNPTASIDPAQVNVYPVGTRPDINWRGYSFNFQVNKSPDGAIEYKSNTFNGALKGKLLVVRFSQNNDIITLTLGGPKNDVISSIDGTSIEGFSGFVDPLDLTEDVKTGNIYVSEFGGDGRITLLRAKKTIEKKIQYATKK